MVTIMALSETVRQSAHASIDKASDETVAELFEAAAVLAELADAMKRPPDETSARCPHYWGSHDKRCELPEHHAGHEHYYLVPASAINLDVDWRPALKAPAALCTHGNDWLACPKCDRAASADLSVGPFKSPADEAADEWQRMQKGAV
jgi:hypothetical protein